MTDTTNTMEDVSERLREFGKLRPSACKEAFERMFANSPGVLETHRVKRSKVTVAEPFDVEQKPINMNAVYAVAPG